MQARGTNITQDSEVGYKQRGTHKKTEKMFGVSRESHMKHEMDKGRDDKQRPIDEVKALKDIFYDFFNANSQAQKKQKDVLVSMTFHEMNINPFHVPETSSANLPDNVAEADEDDGQFGHLERNRLMTAKGGLDRIVEEGNSAINDSAEALSDGNDFKQQLPPDQPRKSTISALSQTTQRLKEDELDEDGQDMPWVDNFRPRLQPDWTEIYKD